MSYSGLEEFQHPEFEGYGPQTSNSVSEDISNEVRESLDAPLVEELVLDDKLEKKTAFPTFAKIEFGHPQKEDQCYVNSTNSNDLVGTEESIGTCHFSKETGSGQYYILMPLWKDGSLFDSSSKNANNDEPQPSSDAEKKDDKGVNKESGIDNQERLGNNTQDVNTAGPSINTASINVNTGSLNINIVSLIVTTAPLEATHANFFGDET
ncbi:hypothetical protein Tco_1424826 [Tanacetum coccineum]